MMKIPIFLSIFLSNWDQFSVRRKFEKSNFLVRTWIEYFHMEIFVKKEYECVLYFSAF